MSIRSASTREPSRAARTSSSTASPLTSPASAQRPPAAVSAGPAGRPLGRHRWLRSHPDSEHYGRAGRGGASGSRRVRRRARHEWRRLESWSATAAGSTPPRSTSWSSLYQRPPPTCRWCAAARPTRRWSAGCPGWCCGPAPRSPAAVGRRLAAGGPVLHGRVPRWRSTGPGRGGAAVATGFSLLSGRPDLATSRQPGAPPPRSSARTQIDRAGRHRLRRLLHRVLRRRTSPSSVWTNNALARRAVPGRRGARRCRCSTCCGRTR